MLWFYRDPTEYFGLLGYFGEYALWHYAQYESMQMDISNIANGYIKGFPSFTDQTFDPSSHQSERVTVQISTILVLHNTGTTMAAFHPNMGNISFQSQGPWPFV